MQTSFKYGPLVEVPFFKINKGDRCRDCVVGGDEWEKLIRENKIKRRSSARPSLEREPREPGLMLKLGI